MQTNDPTTPPTPPNLAETLPVTALEPTLTEARQVPGNEAVAFALETVAAALNSKADECQESTNNLSPSGEIFHLVGLILRDLAKTLEREAVTVSRLSTGGATANIEPSLSS